MALPGDGYRDPTTSGAGKNLQDAEMPFFFLGGGKVSIFAMKFQGPTPGCGCLGDLLLGDEKLTTQ